MSAWPRSLRSALLGLLLVGLGTLVITPAGTSSSAQAQVPADFALSISIGVVNIGDAF